MTEQLQLDLPPAFVKVDDRHGHITLAANPFGQCDAAFVDVGPILHWWAHQSLQLDVAGARALAAALTTWADGKPTSTPGPTPHMARVRAAASEGAGA